MRCCEGLFDQDDFIASVLMQMRKIGHLIQQTQLISSNTKSTSQTCKHGNPLLEMPQNTWKCRVDQQKQKKYNKVKY